MTSEEQNIYDKVKNMKRENELLMVIFEEVDDLVKSGYSGSLLNEDASGILFAVQEYKKWKNDANPT